MEADLFRTGMRRMAGAVSVVTVLGDDGERRGITVTSVCSLCAEPPSLLTCINQKTWVGQLVRDGCAFSVSVLTVNHRVIAEVFAGRSGLAGGDRFQIGTWINQPARAPMLADALVCFDCTLDRAVPFGTHLILIGTVGQTVVHPGEALPLVYGEGDFATTTRQFDTLSQLGQTSAQTG